MYRAIYRTVASLAAFGVWSIFPSVALAAGFESFGAGCPDRSGVAPSLEIDGHANPGGSVILRFDGAANRSQVFLFAGLGASVPGAPGCLLELASPSPIPLGPIQLDAQGQFTLTTNIPGALPAPFDFAIQAVELDELAPNGQYGISNGMRVELSVGRLYPEKTFSLGKLPIGFAWGDIDGDGDGDVIGVDGPSAPVPIALGDGGGNFSPGTPFLTAATAPNGVAAGDLDGDGDLDLALTGYWIALHFGDGAGNFSPSQLHAGWIPKFAPVLSDLEGDGNVDVLALETATDRLHVLRGLGAGAFAIPSQLHSVGDEPRELAVGDLDGDGFLDVAVANADDQAVSVLFGAPGGHLAPAQSVIVPGQPWSVAIADMNLDAVDDLVVGSQITQQIAVLRGDGSGGFLAPQITPACDGFWSLQVFDHDEDSIPDVVSANGLSRSLCLHRGAGDGTLTHVDESELGTPATLTRVVDVDGDGASEFLALAPQRSFSIVEREKDTPFVTSSRYPVHLFPDGLATHDLDSDGFLDLVAGSRLGTSVHLGVVGTRRGGPDGTFGSAVDHFVNLAISDLACGDIDDDGNVDVVSSSWYGDLEVLLGDGSGSFSLPVVVANSTSSYAIRLADLNGDGIADAVSSDVDSTSGSPFRIGVRLSAPGVVLPSFAAFVTVHRPESLVVADFDLDGALDVVTSHPDGDSVSILRGNGQGALSAAMPFVIGSSPVAMASADVDRDGYPDLAIARPYVQTIAVLRNDANGGFFAPTNLETGGSPSDVDLVDLDGDGDADLLHSGGVASSIVIRPGDGFGGFGGKQQYAAGGAYEIVVGNFGLDSTPDLAAMEGNFKNSGSIHVLLHR